MKRTPIARTTRLRSRSPKRASWDRALAAARPIVEARSGGRCEYDGDHCENRAVHVHHKLNGSSGHAHPRCNDPEFLLHLCGRHHDQIHAEPEVSYSQGWLLRFEDVPR